MKWGGRLPATAVDVAKYIAAHGGKLSVATLQRRLVAIGKLHQDGGFADPTASTTVKAVLRGIKRVHGAHQKQAAPVPKEALLTTVAKLGNTLLEKRDRALLLFGFASALRRSELVALAFEDLDFDLGALRLRVRRSKTDPYARGRWIDLGDAEIASEATGALLAWLSSAEIFDGPVFQKLSRTGQLGSHGL